MDKTSYIPMLIEGSKYYFLARPRRFGKSLFLSTLEYFFSGERELFKGLSIDSYNWDWDKYPVIHIDLNGTDYAEADALMNRLYNNLEAYENLYGIEAKIDQNPSERFRMLITNLYKKTGKQIMDRDYALPFKIDSRKVFLIGVNFSTEKKRLDGFLIETIS